MITLIIKYQCAIAIFSGHEMQKKKTKKQHYYIIEPELKVKLQNEIKEKK